MKNRNEFLCLLDELFELPPGSLTGQEALADLEGWGSMAVVSFMALADEHYGVTLSPRQFGNCVTVNDLLALIGDKLPA